MPSSCDVGFVGAGIVVDRRRSRRRTEKKQVVSYSTVQTILRIPRGQRATSPTRKSPGAFAYRPVIDERQARRRALNHLVARLFDGSPGLLVLNVLEDEQIDPAELKQLKKLLDEA